jgi:hypothetical protein
MEITLESRLKIATKEHYYTLERFLDHYVDKGGSYEDYDKFINDGLLTTNLLSFICKTLYNVNIEWLITGEGEKENYRKKFTDAAGRYIDAMEKKNKLEDELNRLKTKPKTVKMDLLKIISNN